MKRRLGSWEIGTCAVIAWAVGLLAYGVFIGLGFPWGEGLFLASLIAVAAYWLIVRIYSEWD